MAILVLPDDSRIQVSDDMRARDVVKLLEGLGYGSPILYDRDRGMPLAPDEPVGSREIIVLIPSGE